MGCRELDRVVLIACCAGPRRRGDCQDHTGDPCDALPREHSAWSGGEYCGAAGRLLGWRGLLGITEFWRWQGWTLEARECAYVNHETQRALLLRTAELHMPLTRVRALLFIEVL